MGNFIKGLIILSVFLMSTSCTQTRSNENQTNQSKVYSKSFSDPNKLIAEIAIDASAKVKKGIKKTDSLIWSMVGKDGQVIAAQILNDINLPHTISLTTKDLIGSVPANSSLVFTARVVKQGDEYSEPKPSQPKTSYGNFALDDPQLSQVVKPAISPEKLMQIEKKLKIQETKKFVVGEKVAVQLQ